MTPSGGIYRGGRRESRSIYRNFNDGIDSMDRFDQHPWVQLQRPDGSEREYTPYRPLLYEHASA